MHRHSGRVGRTPRNLEVRQSTLEPTDLTESAANPDDARQEAEDGSTSDSPRSVATRVLRNMVVLVAGQVLSLPLVMVTSIVLVRALGPEGFGTYSVVYAFLTLFTWLTNYGMDNVLVREGSQRPEDLGAIWGTGIALSAIATAAAMGVAALSAAFTGYISDFGSLMILAGVEILLLAPLRLFSVVFQVELQQWKSVAPSLVRAAAWLGVVFLLATSGASVTQFVAWRTVLSVIEIAAVVSLALPLFSKSHLKFDKAHLLMIFKSATPLAVTQLAIAVYLRIDRILIEKISGAAEVGYYATADNVVNLIAIIPLAFMMSVYPVLCRRVDSERSFEKIGGASFRLVLVGIAAFLGVFLIAGRPLVVLAYTEEFAYSADILKVLLVAQVATGYGVVLAQMLISQDLQRFLTVSTVCGAVLNIVGNLLLVPRYGAVGAAWATVASYWLAGILFFELFPSTRKYSRIGLKHLVHVGLVFVISFLPAGVLFSDSYLSAALSLAIFGVLLLVFRVVGRDDVDLVIAAIRGGREPASDTEFTVSPDQLSAEETQVDSRIRQIQEE